MIADEVEERMQTTNFMRQHVRGARQKVLMEQMLKDRQCVFIMQAICFFGQLLEKCNRHE